jgi:hypothetical protein
VACTSMLISATVSAKLQTKSNEHRLTGQHCVHFNCHPHITWQHSEQGSPQCALGHEAHQMDPTEDAMLKNLSMGEAGIPHNEPRLLLAYEKPRPMIIRLQDMMDESKR